VIAELPRGHQRPLARPATKAITGAQNTIVQINRAWLQSILSIAPLSPSDADAVQV
jgi:hypothetical protein